MGNPLRVVWCTDLHLDMARDEARQRFRDALRACEPDVLIVTGDLSVAAGLEEDLTFLTESSDARFFVVLGNHDFWGSSVPAVRFAVGGIAARAQSMGRDVQHLTRSGVVELTPSTALVGHDGWYDARTGAFHTTEVVMNDFRLIDEFARCTRRFELIHMARQYSQQAACELQPVLARALESYPEVIVATHVPPWRGAYRHETAEGDEDSAPWFVSKEMGGMIEDLAERYRDRNILVLCGHTHTRTEFRPRSNIRCLAGGAEYGRPGIEEVFLLPEAA